MATDWKSSLAASDRYEVIQKIRDSLPGQSMSDAIALEQKAYQDSTTKDEYDAAVDAARNMATQISETVTNASSIPPPYGSPQTGIRIGAFHDCVPIGDGITSEVFRAGDKALKVIVSQHNMEPHSPQREVKILRTLHPPCIPLDDVFRDQEQRLVLVFPFMPLTLADLLDRGPLSTEQVRLIFSDSLRALQSIHSQGIVHRDVKPSAILLSSPSGPAFLSDFGTAWHPELSVYSEPPNNKILDIGTGAYRAPEVLFADKSYGPPVDMWGLGVMLAEAICTPPSPPFESRSAHEDGNQLGLILSIFKTLGTPTPDTWPEARQFKVSPFELWTVFPPKSWEQILPNVNSSLRNAVRALVRYDGGRATAEQALGLECFANE